MTAQVAIEARPVSLLDVLLSVSTEFETPDFNLESQFEGQTCLVAGDESALATSMRGLLESARRSSVRNRPLTATLVSTGQMVTLSVSERGSPAQWILQFPELHV